MNAGQEENSGIANRRLQKRITDAQERLSVKLSTVDFGSSGISEYNQRYLREKLASLDGVLQLYGRLLYLVLSDRSIEPENVVMIDYGGGSGLISLLAADLGVGTVVYNDIYDVSCTDVRILARNLDLDLDHIVCGDITDLAIYMEEQSLIANAVVSYDVLEHIYDVQSHFTELAALPGNDVRVVHASGANPENPYYLRHVRKKQLEAEYRKRSRERGHKERDTLNAYLEVRREIIAAYAPDLSSEQVEILARSTRGLMHQDIRKCVDDYRVGGKIEYRMDHPTNTCDPYTGNWCEHLMDLGWLRRIIEDAGFSVTIEAGYYHTGGGVLKRSIKRALNATIRVLGRRGMYLSPYYVVTASAGAQDEQAD